MEIPDWVTRLPAINAALNGTATLLLICGLLLIRRGRRDAHKRVMLSAFAVSVVFLACYLVYHFALDHYTGSGSRPFRGTGFIRPVYFAVLISHVLLAAATPFLAIATIVLALRQDRRVKRGLQADWRRHTRIAKVTFPVWLYVSVTGVVIYVMVYHFN